MAITPTVSVKKDGTRVKAHKRTEPDGICNNNLKLFYSFYFFAL